MNINKRLAIQEAKYQARLSRLRKEQALIRKKQKLKQLKRINRRIKLVPVSRLTRKTIKGAKGLRNEIRKSGISFNPDFYKW